MNEKAGASVLFGLAAGSSALLLTELLLSRLFSAASGYHFAFMILSLAMFGITLGAILAAKVPDAEVKSHLQSHCAWFAASIPLVFGVVGLINSVFMTSNALAWVLLAFIVCIVPFYFSGVVICLCLTRFPQTGVLYGADLLGAALACPLFVALLSHTDILNSFVFAGVLAAVASFCLGRGAANPRLNAVSAVALIVCIASAFVLPRKIGGMDPKKDVRWSPIACVSINEVVMPAVTWTEVKPGPPVRQKLMAIDYRAGTQMTAGDATPEQLEPIKLDLTALADRLRPGGDLFVLGVGGGRDILTGLLFGQKHVDAVEVNPAVVKLLRDEFGDFNGHLANKPGVTLVNNEARNWLEGSHNKYNVVQSSLVDTWAASASGAFMLSENALYTKEAFAQFVRHLKPGGIFSCLRWGDAGEPAQPVRLIGLAKYALAQQGITDAAPNLALLSGTEGFSGHSVCNLLISNQPLSKADIAVIAEQAKTNGFKILYAPGMPDVEPFKSAVVEPATADEYLPSDDRPFFFTPSIFSKTKAMADTGADNAWMLLMLTLGQAIVMSLVLVLPFAKRSYRQEVVSMRLFQGSIVFASVGLAFMLVEVAQINRLTIVLGSPSYALTVVLFVLLLASATGSLVSQQLVNRGQQARKILIAGLLLSGVTIIASGFLSHAMLGMIGELSLWQRIALSSICVGVPGFFMGWSVPMALSHFGDQHTKAWYWALNGAASVVGSVLAAIAEVSFGVTLTLAAGAIAYLIAGATSALQEETRR